jgi:hypothetical protein
MLQQTDLRLGASKLRKSQEFWKGNMEISKIFRKWGPADKIRPSFLSPSPRIFLIY